MRGVVVFEFHWPPAKNDFAAVLMYRCPWTAEFPLSDIGNTGRGFPAPGYVRFYLSLTSKPSDYDLLAVQLVNGPQVPLLADYTDASPAVPGTPFILRWSQAKPALLGALRSLGSDILEERYEWAALDHRTGSSDPKYSAIDWCVGINTHPSLAPTCMIWESPKG